MNKKSGQEIVIIPSDASSEEFPYNTLSNFIVKLPEQNEFDKEVETA